jgi:acyl-homoserine lactone acylase PvdQ
MEQAIHAPASAAGPAIDARGVAFPGTNVVVQLGHGRDYAWSATSAGQDIIDTFAVPLCEPGGGRPQMDSMHYRYDGRCRAFEVLTRTNDWAPTLADDTAAGSQTLRALRTPVGIVTARAEIDGKPYAYTRLRVTYNHEVDSAIGFAAFNTPGLMDNPREFFKAACKIDYTFNWMYINRRHIAYFNSGANPVRSPLTDPNFPAFANKRYRWRDYETRLFTEDRIPCRKRPQAIDQDYLTSWNNKQAPGYRAADSRFDWNSLDRVLPLNDRIERGIRGPKKMNLVELVSAMEDAGTVDLRGAYILPWILKVIGRGPGGDVGEALDTLAAWMRAGAHRRDANHDGVYDQARAVQIMDAWWPLLVEAQFKPVLGQDLFDAIRGMVGFVDHPGDDSPNQGSAFDDGWWFVEKDLRTLLGAPVRGEYSRIYCGRGNLRRCRAALLGSLSDALEVPYAQTYPGGCEQGDAQWCYDAVEHRATGLVGQPPIHWINRPTFQQAVEIGR